MSVANQTSDRPGARGRRSTSTAGSDGDVTVDLELARAHGMDPHEFEALVAGLGRVPNITELSLFSAMWNEHCSYKSSRRFLKRLPTQGPAVVQGPGENAGVVRVAEGFDVAFKIESHNHPSYVEPHQGAATGVGGILRDIIVMGARPVAILDSLHLGPPEDARSGWVARGVVSGIAAYGNCIGVPTVGGEIHVAECYRNNPLVNVMGVGLMGPAGLRRGVAQGPGNPLIVFGARTGRDGIHGATFASAELDENSSEDRPAVQVADPLTGKLLLEACQDLFGLEGLVGIQDMGAAGLTSSTAEMAHRAKTGLRLDLNRIPMREAAMTPSEIMLSETQERMVLVMRRGTEDSAVAVLQRYGLDWAVAGEVTDDGLYTLTLGERVVAQVPVELLNTGCPPAPRSRRRPRRLAQINDPSQLVVEFPASLEAAWIDLIGSPNLCSRKPVYQQYDHMVGLGTLARPGEADAAVLRLMKPGSENGSADGVWIALTTDVNARACWLDPRQGALQSVAEAARNLACVGARPVGMTDGLNFASPRDPEVYWDFAEVIEGIREASLALEVPVTGGNVSFYNETPAPAASGRKGRASKIHPTPVIGMVGVIEGAPRLVRTAFPSGGLTVFLLGTTAGHLGGSEFLARKLGTPAGPVPRLDWMAERALQRFLRAAIGAGILASAHDLSTGGLAAALSECCSVGRGAPVGFLGRLEPIPRADLALFSEEPSRALVSVEPSNELALKALATECQVPCWLLGRTGGNRLALEGLCDLPLESVLAARERPFYPVHAVTKATRDPQEVES